MWVLSFLLCESRASHATSLNTSRREIKFSAGSHIPFDSHSTLQKKMT